MCIILFDDTLSEDVYEHFEVNILRGGRGLAFFLFSEKERGGVKAKERINSHMYSLFKKFVIHI